jgi:hypothetical protein
MYVTTCQPLQFPCLCLSFRCILCCIFLLSYSIGDNPFHSRVDLCIPVRPSILLLLFRLIFVSTTPTCTCSPQCLVSFKPVVCKTYILTYLGRILKAGDCHSWCRWSERRCFIELVSSIRRYVVLMPYRDEFPLISFFVPKSSCAAQLYWVHATIGIYLPLTVPQVASLWH